MSQLRHFDITWGGKGQWGYVGYIYMGSYTDQGFWFVGVLSQAEKGSFMIEDSSGGFRSTTAIWIIYEDYLYLCNIDNDNGYPDGWCSRKTNNNDEKD